MRGTRLAPTGWAELWQEENEGRVMMIPIVGGEVDPQWPEKPLTREASDETLQWMIAGAGRAYRDRMMDEESDEEFDEDDYNPETFFRPEPKIGRNEPCPCASSSQARWDARALDRSRSEAGGTLDGDYRAGEQL
jgi:hypothetical protein